MFSERSINLKLPLLNKDPIGSLRQKRFGFTNTLRTYARFLKVPLPPDGAVLVNALNIGTIQFWDVTTGDKIAALDGYTQGINMLAFSPDGTTLVNAATDGTILLWDWDEVLTDSSKSE